MGSSSAQLARGPCAGKRVLSCAQTPATWRLPCGSGSSQQPASSDHIASPLAGCSRCSVASSSCGPLDFPTPCLQPECEIEGVDTVTTRGLERLRSSRFTARTTASSIAEVLFCCSIRELIALPCFAVLSDTPAMLRSSSLRCSWLSRTRTSTRFSRSLPIATWPCCCGMSRSSRHCETVSRCTSSSWQPSRTWRHSSSTLRCINSSSAICETSLRSSASSITPECPVVRLPFSFI
mmetsp:Transcript_132543/g.264510  ORF Transcript_132543/g.264510 Transcript_132543/m.264510 type:complete len:236 (+) Transcript_132543:971-1678(+)